MGDPKDDDWEQVETTDSGYASPAGTPAPLSLAMSGTQTIPQSNTSITSSTHSEQILSSGWLAILRNNGSLDGASGGISMLGTNANYAVDPSFLTQGNPQVFTGTGTMWDDGNNGIPQSNPPTQLMSEELFWKTPSPSMSSTPPPQPSEPPLSLNQSSQKNNSGPITARSQHTHAPIALGRALAAGSNSMLNSALQDLDHWRKKLLLSALQVPSSPNIKLRIQNSIEQRKDDGFIRADQDFWICCKVDEGFPCFSINSLPPSIIGVQLLSDIPMPQPFQDFSLADAYMLLRSISVQTGRKFESQYIEKRDGLMRDAKKHNRLDYGRFVVGEVELWLEKHIKEENSFPTKWKTVSHIAADHFNGSCRLFKLTKILIQLMNKDESCGYCMKCRHLVCDKCYKLRNKLNDLRMEEREKAGGRKGNPLVV